MHPILLDAAGRRRQPVTLPGYHAGRPPRNKGRRYPADPPTIEETIAVMRTAGAGADGMRLRAVIVVLRRAGLRIGEALALAETDLDARRGAVLVRHGKGDKRREVGMDSWAWEQLEPWQQLRVRFPVGPFFCVIHGPTAGRNWEPASARRQLSRTPPQRESGVGSLRINMPTRSLSRLRPGTARNTGARRSWIGITRAPVIVLLGAFLKNDLLHPSNYVAVDVLSLSSEQTGATNVWLHADMTQKPLTIGSANLLGLRS